MYDIPKLMRHNESNDKRKVHGTKCLQKENRVIAYKQLYTALENTRDKKEANTPKRSRLQEIFT